jgi:phospholipase C
MKQRRADLVILCAVATAQIVPAEGGTMKPRRRDTPRRPVPQVFAWRAAMAVLVLPALSWGCAGREVAAPRAIDRIRHVIVIYMKNWSFDGQFGLFPGANGIANAGDTIRQVRKDGSPYTSLPQPLFQGRPDPRIPAMIISPFAKKGFVDHTQYETVSILKFIATRWGLPPLEERDRYANNLTHAFEF